MSCVLGMDGRSVELAAGKVRQSDGHHCKSRQDMATGVSNHERVSPQTFGLLIAVNFSLTLYTLRDFYVLFQYFRL